MFTVRAEDAAGTPEQPHVRQWTVDVTPPEATTHERAGRELGKRTATVTFTGTDGVTPTAGLGFTWRLISPGTLDPAFSAFATTSVVSFSDLAEGAHTFEVKARDAPGNEDPTPASRPSWCASGSPSRWSIHRTAPRRRW